MGRGRWGIAACALAWAAAVTVAGRGPAQDKQENRAAVRHFKPGPWGDLEYHSIYLEAPDNLLALYPLPNTVPHWVFPGATRAVLDRLFQRAGLPDDMRARLLAPDAVEAANGALHVHPAVGDVEAMTPGARAVIYSELARWPQNPFYYDPVLILSGSVEQWLHNADVRPEIQARIATLTYRRGEVLAFSDVEALMSYAESDREARHLFKTLTRIRTMIVRLQLGAGHDLPALVSYWSAGYRRKDILPILQSTVETEGMPALDLVHLLPPLPRKLLYTYPTPDLATSGRMPDCHWTSLNFFNYTPENLFLDTRLRASRLLENYAAVKPPYQYGDILFVLDTETGTAIHSCVYLADTLVFTKNGESVLSPWILMTLDDIHSLYLKDGDTEVVGYRRNPQAEN